MGLFGWLFGPNVKRLAKNKDTESLVRALQYKEDAKVRATAARALGDLRDRRAVEPPITAIRDPDRDVRWNAVSALGDIGDRSAVEPLITALRDPDWDVRCFTASALWDLRDRRSVEPLIAALGDPYDKVRETAAMTLLRIDDPRARQYREMCEQIIESKRGRTAL